MTIATALRFMRAVGAILVAVAIVLVSAPAGAASNHKIKGTITLGGTVVTLTGDKTIDIRANLEGSDIASLKGECVGSNGYSDLQAGAPVVVKNDKGRTIATSSLDAGVPGTRQCVFGFTAKVPDATFYVIEVTHRGEVTYSRKQLEKRKWRLALSLS
jgi:hypothetical protein